MKKIILLLAVAATVISCETKNETTTKPATEFKTAYVDASKMMEDCTEAKDIDEKYKAKYKELDSQFSVEGNRLQNEIASFEQNARANGQAWAQQKGAELSNRKQRLDNAAQGALQKLQYEAANEMDSLRKNIRDLIKSYGKEKGYDYIYGTGESPSVLYAREGYDITAEITKLVNEKYADRKEGKPEVKEEAKK